MTNSELFRQLIANDTDDCIVWPNGQSGQGYGAVWHDGRMHQTHRLALHMAKGAPPHPSMVACHGPCHNRLCINPRHLSWQTRKENTHDRKRDGTSRSHKAKLTFEQAEDIRLKFITGEYTKAELGREYGIPGHSIHNIVEHITYIY